MKRGIAAFVVLACVLPCLAQPGGPITLESLLNEMLDRTMLARWPEPAYTCRQFSSYDRDTVAPDQPGWFANWDRSQFLRVEEVAGRKEYVMMDADGPGAVVRIWATWHGPHGQPFSNGTIRFYLDDSDTPAIEGPITDIIDGGALAGPPLAEGVAPQTEYARRGHNLYLPIPYARHCRITYSTDVPVDVGGKQGEALYYQINYRTYEPGTDVRTFLADELTRIDPRIEFVQQRLIASEVADDDQEHTHGLVCKLEPEISKLVGIYGPAAISEIQLRLSAKDLPQALRSTVLEIEFDGERTVWCPVGDFFGIGYQIRPVKTWYTQVTEDGTMTCRWTMPFRQDCRVYLHNIGKQPVVVESGHIRTTKWNWDDRSMHFHAAWRHYPKTDTGESNSMDAQPGARDMNFVEVKGKGVYVGDSLVVFNGTDAWWGEGDEKIYVDGETFPSHIGTGTEDYYGYAWCRPEPFSSPFHAQPEGGGNMAGGYSVNSRYRALDAIPFERSLRFDMELWHWGVTNIDYTPTTFWYARPGASANVELDPQGAAKPVTLRREQIVEPVKVRGATEGEALADAHATGGRVSIQSGQHFRWSEDNQLWWMDAAVGDTLEATFEVDQTGRYDILAALTTAPDYGVVRIAINGAPAGHYDLYETRVRNTTQKLGAFDLHQGPNKIVIEIENPNPAAKPRNGFGLDYLLLTPVR